MQLSFATELTFNEGLKTCLSHEPDNTFTAFFLKDKRIGNKSADPIDGNFVDLVFAAEPRRMTANPAKDFGVKTFPHFGSFGYYTPLYGATSIMLIPINRKQDKRNMPDVVITDTGTTIHLAITGDYECYRIIVRLDYFATEYITYDDEFDFVPMYTGDCIITVIGHSNETSVTSKPFEQEMALVDRTEEVITPSEGGGYTPDGQTIVLNAQNKLAISGTITDKIATKIDDVELQGNNLRFFADNVLTDNISLPVGEGGGVPAVETLDMQAVYNILVITDVVTHGAPTVTKSTLEGLGHTVTLQDTASFISGGVSGNYDIVLPLRITVNTTHSDNFKALYNTYNVLLGFSQPAGNSRLVSVLNIATTTSIAQLASNYAYPSTHIILEGIPALQAVPIYASSEFTEWLTSISVGTPLMFNSMSEHLHTVLAIEAGTLNLVSEVMPKRTGFIGFLYGREAYTLYAKTIIDRMIRWVVQGNAKL